MSEEAEVILGEGKFVRLKRRGNWEIVERIGSVGAVFIVATTDKNEIILVRQWREPVGQFVWELPAGLRDKGGESSIKTAQRELLEETGYIGGAGEVVWSGPVNPGVMAEEAEFVRIKGCKHVNGGGGVDGEEITVAVVAISEAKAMLERMEEQGDLVDVRIYAGMWMIKEAKP